MLKSVEQAVNNGGTWVMKMHMFMGQSFSSSLCLGIFRNAMLGEEHNWKKEESRSL